MCIHAETVRLAEQYLIRAEAYCRMGASYYGKAGIDISTLRMARYSSYGGSTTLTEENWFKTVSEERMKNSLWKVSVLTT